MNTDYCFLRRFFVWLRRIRHRCGYGIHSPFVFHLVTDVIYCREPYYAYAELSLLRRNLCGRLSEKDEQLLFRLGNACKAEKIAIVGQGDERVSAYLRAARPKAEISSHASGASLSAIVRQHDFVFISSPLSECLSVADSCLGFPPPLSAGTLIVCFGIHRDAASRKCWQQLCASSHVTISLDLHRFGLLYFLPQFRKQHYIVNYF